MKQNNICIIIPAYNEESSIGWVIKNIKKYNSYLNYENVIVNDGSTDETLKIAKKQKCIVLDLPINLGIGGAVQTGLIYARENGFDIAVQIDADGQHNPASLKILLTNLKKDVDLVIGSRYVKKTNYKTPAIRLVGIRLFSFLIKLVTGMKVYDSTSGYRVFGKKAIDYFSHNYPQDFPEPKSLVSFIRSGHSVREVAVQMNKRQGGKSSVSGVFKAIYLVASISIGILVESLKEKKAYE